MNLNETSRILSVLAAAYPRFQVDEAGVTLKVWHRMLKDIDYKAAQLAAEKLILESPFPPSIADIRKAAAEVMTPPEERINSAQAWGEVEKAIRCFGYYREKEALESMSPRTAKVVKYMGWQEICLSDQPGVARGQFLKMYKTVSEREEKEKLLPISLKHEIQSLAGGMRMIGGGKKDETA